MLCGFWVVFFIYVVIIYENLIFFKKIWISLIKKKGFLKEGDYSFKFDFWCKKYFILDFVFIMIFFIY